MSILAHLPAPGELAQEDRGRDEAECPPEPPRNVKSIPADWLTISIPRDGEMCSTPKKRNPHRRYSHEEARCVALQRDVRARRSQILRSQGAALPKFQCWSWGYWRCGKCQSWHVGHTSFRSPTRALERAWREVVDMQRITA